MKTFKKIASASILVSAFFILGVSVVNAPDSNAAGMTCGVGCRPISEGPGGAPGGNGHEGGGGGGGTPTAPFCTLIVDPNTFATPGTVNITWETWLLKDFTIAPTVGVLFQNSNAAYQTGSKNVTVSETTTFVGTGVDLNGAVVTCTDAVTVTSTPPVDVCPNIDGTQTAVPSGYQIVGGQCVLIPPLPVCTMSVNPTSVRHGESALLTWSTTNVTSGTIDNNVGPVGPSGSYVVSPMSSGVYSGVFTGPGGTVTCTAPITVTTTTTNPPQCELNLNRFVISWSTIFANLVTIIPLTNSPQVPGASGGTQTGSTSVFNGDFGQFKSQYASVFQADATTNGGVALGNASFKANKATADRLCGLVFPGSVNGTFNTDTFASPGNNTIAIWTGSAWSVVTARGNDPHLRNSRFTCVQAVAGGTGTHPLSGSHTFVPPLGVGTHTYRLTATGPDGVKQCDATVVVPPDEPPPTDVCPNIAGTQTSVPAGYQLVNGQCVVINTTTPICSLTINKSKIKTGESVKVSWTSANVTSGTINSIGNVTPVAGGTSEDLFPSDSTTYTGTFTGPNGSVTCTVSVEVEKGSGGCQGNCGGGGLNQPNVTLLNKPGDQPLAFVSLSQVPYTGFEAGTLLTILFWLAVAVWSAGIAYLVVGKQGMRLMASQLMNGSAALTAVALHDDEVQEPKRALIPSVIQATAPAAHPAFADMSVTPLSDTLESQAHREGVLLSPEALETVLNISTDPSVVTRTFERILDGAVKTFPREDGWILLSSDRVMQLLAPARMTPAPTPIPAPIAEAASTPVAPVAAAPMSDLLDSAVEQLVKAVLEGNRDSAFTLVREFEAEGVSATKVMSDATLLVDRLYQARKSGTSVGNPSLDEKVARLSPETLYELATIFANALGATYALPYTGLKIALAQSFDKVN